MTTSTQGNWKYDDPAWSVIRKSSEDELRKRLPRDFAERLSVELICDLAPLHTVGCRCLRARLNVNGLMDHPPCCPAIAVDRIVGPSPTYISPEAIGLKLGEAFAEDINRFIGE